MPLKRSASDTRINGNLPPPTILSNNEDGHESDVSSEAKHLTLSRVIVEGDQDNLYDSPGQTSRLKAPDGGWGWVVVLASFMIHVIADGVTYSFGVLTPDYLTYYKTSRETVGWLGSIMVGITLGSGPLASILCGKFGFQTVTIAGAILAALGFMAPYLYDELWFLFVTAAFITGLGFGFMYLPAIVTVGLYFENKRALAIGLAVCGSGIGTFLFGPFIEYLLNYYTWRETMLIVGAIILNCIVCGVVFRPLVSLSEEEKNCSIRIDEDESKDKLVSVEPRKRARTESCSSTREIRLIGKLTPMAVSYASLAQNYMSNPNLMISSLISMNREHRHSHGVKPQTTFSQFIKSIFDPDLMKDPIFILFVLSNFFTSLGFNAPFLYAKDRALQHDIESTKASFLIAAIGIGNTFGRVVFGALSSRAWVNRLMLYNTVLVCCGLCIMLSSFCTTYPWMIAYTTGFGILSGVYVTLTSVVLVDLLGIDKLNDSFGLTMLSQGIAVFIGPPMAGWIYDKTNSYDGSFWLCGSMIGISGLMLYPVPLIRKYYARKAEAKKRNIERGTQ